MTSNPRTIADNALATEAIFIMNQKSITVLPVTRENQLVGVLHIHDILRHGVA
jgi:arabinose-5-phosphate isomerase